MNDQNIILVTGNLSSGKSSLINALLGKYVLPVKALPNTLIRTEINFSNENKIIAYRKDDNKTVFKYSSDEECRNILEKLYSEDIVEIENGLMSQYAKVCVFGLFNVLEKGGCFIETFYNEPTQKFKKEPLVSDVNKSSIIVYCMNACQILASTDRDMLDYFRENSKNVAVVVTHTDLLEKEEIHKVKAWVTTNLSDYISSDHICFVDSTTALKSKNQDSLKGYLASGMLDLEKILPLK